MPTTKHIAIAPDGTTFKRTSKSKVYTHLTLGQRSEDHAWLVANSKVSQEQDGKNWDFYLQQAEGRWTCSSYERNTYNSPGHDEWVAKSKARDVSKGQEFLAENPTREGFIAKRLADRLAAVQATDFTEWHDLGWSSRQDLGERNAASHRNKPYWAKVILVEATIVA